MSFDHCSAGRAGKEVAERDAQIAEARQLLAAALGMLDRQGLWQAAATVDMAIHQIDRHGED